jgi:hypothetical protein
MTRAIPSVQTLRHHLIGAGTIAPDDPQLELLLDVARRVLNDCNEILGLLL